ncbi:MAG: uracil-DNA glycosylase [Candidatus Yonathbacteria bacterium]|nr:uracil-DNA glycosylase [Candidatus Yonathbacteria bacterium]
MKDTIAVNPLIEESWREALAEEFNAPYFKEIKKKILEEKKAGVVLYPPGKEIFNAYNLTPFHQVKVVILGQDPYHGVGQAHGLCFSVPIGVTPPPSLKNIFKEIKNDLGIEISKEKGNLEGWAGQGVLLLNALLTVRAGEPASHHEIGWEIFTDATIKKLSDEREHLVFILWGKFAEQKENLIDARKHLILKSAHPSPFSATKFFGNKHFSKTNEYLTRHGKGVIDWGNI